MITRRDLLRGVAGTVGLLGWPPGHASGEPPPETTRLRVHHSLGICLAPIYVAEDLLRARASRTCSTCRTGQRGSTRRSAPARPTSAATSPRSSSFSWIEGRRSWSWRDPRRLLRAVRHRAGPCDPRPEGEDRRRARAGYSPARLSCQHGGLRRRGSPQGHRLGHASVRRVDAAPGPRERSMRSSGSLRSHRNLRAKRIGHVVVNSAVDRPWSQYFCCMAVANQDFARKYPVATKRALRAILKAADICALDPDRAAKSLEAQGVAKRYDYALQTMKDVPYTKWRNYDPEDTMRFYALRLNEIGHDQVEPAEDHRAGHGLAVPQGAEEGAEGMIDRASTASCAASRATARAARLDARPRLPRRAAAGDDEAAARAECRGGSAWRPSTWPRTAARRRIHRLTVRTTSAGGPVAEYARGGEGGHHHALRRRPSSSAWTAGTPSCSSPESTSGVSRSSATDRVRAIRDLKGKTVGVSALGGAAAYLLRQHGGLGGSRSAQGHQLA